MEWRHSFEAVRKLREINKLMEKDGIFGYS